MNIEEFKSILIENVGKYDEITDSQTLRFIEATPEIIYLNYYHMQKSYILI